MRPRSAASALAFFAAFSLSILSRSLASLSAFSRLKISLPLTRCAAGSAGGTIGLVAALVVVRFVEDMDVERG